jgi:hypothetical protein
MQPFVDLFIHPSRQGARVANASRLLESAAGNVRAASFEELSREAL